MGVSKLEKSIILHIKYTVVSRNVHQFSNNGLSNGRFRKT